MNMKKWLVATIGAFVVICAADFVVHQVWLGAFYKQHAEWWRPEAEMMSMMPLMYLAHLTFAGLLTLIYAKGYERGKGGGGQGLRFGLLIGLLLSLPMSLMHCVVYPYPFSLIVAWFVGGLAEVVLAGMVIGALYTPA